MGFSDFRIKAVDKTSGRNPRRGFQKSYGGSPILNGHDDCMFLGLPGTPDKYWNMITQYLAHDQPVSTRAGFQIPQ